MSTIATQIYAKIPFDATPGQKKVVELLSSYLEGGDAESIFVLNGYAGTGKTTVLAALVKAMKERGGRPVLLAPTGRAAKVLSKYAGEPAHTIHKRIYRQGNDGKFSLNINKDKGAVYIVDEASMLANATAEKALFGSGALLDDLIEYVRSGTGCRLILVGDDAQLPPVGEERSPALDSTYLSMYGDVIYTSLDEVVRQEADSGILHNATLVRKLLEEGGELGEGGMPKFDLSYPDIEAITGHEFMEKLEECYGRYGGDETIVVTRSNKRANRYNDGIRRIVQRAEGEIEGGDRLMIVKNNYLYTGREEDCAMTFIANGDTAMLRRLRRFEEKHGFRYATAQLSFGDYGTELEVKILLDALTSESPALTRTQMDALYASVEAEYSDIKNRGKRWVQMREDEYLNAVQVKFAYAVTCHKAQGGQWRAVFVDRCIFGDEPMSREMLRWLYTALTRATEKLYLVNF